MKRAHWLQTTESVGFFLPLLHSVLPSQVWTICKPGTHKSIANYCKFIFVIKLIYNDVTKKSREQGTHH